jgi:hypothetical protein
MGPPGAARPCVGMISRIPVQEFEAATRRNCADADLPTVLGT